MIVKHWRKEFWRIRFSVTVERHDYGTPTIPNSKQIKIWADYKEKIRNG